VYDWFEVLYKRRKDVKKKRLRENESSSTTDRLLDAAERLFAEHGYDGVGMRTLTDEAGVNLGAATYHFGSKEKLYIETIMRCLRPISEERIRLLRQAEKKAKGKPVPVETIIDCMLRPPFMTAVGHPYFPALLARNLFMPPPFMPKFMDKEGGSVHEPFIAALARTLPNLSMELLRIREKFVRGVLLMFLSKIPMQKSPEYCESVLKEMVTFIAAGLRTEVTISDADLQLITFSQPPPVT
jgi:AcrR family transcriptional regulator